MCIKFRITDIFLRIKTPVERNKIIIIYIIFDIKKMIIKLAIKC